MTTAVQFSSEVATARASGKPIVALESTIIAHGMPYPQNVETARAVEQIVRQNGAAPATIAIIGGNLKVGLSDAELDRFGREGAVIRKVSTRDLPHVVAMRADGATTVASTMRIAAMAGIAVFATGGIGGVHRGAETSFDVSADLSEISQTDVAVVTAGAKAILDLALTLEILETMGVPVVGYGTDVFPAFYSRDSGLAVPMRCDHPDQVAALMKAKWTMGLAGGVVVANPIPAEFEIPASEILPWIEEAVAAAQVKAVKGRDVTPFLLARLAERTGGRSLAANIALVKHNAKIAAEIAVAYGKLTP